MISAVSHVNYARIREVRRCAVFGVILNAAVNGIVVRDRHIEMAVLPRYADPINRRRRGWLPNAIAVCLLRQVGMVLNDVAERLIQLLTKARKLLTA